ncbi:MAG: hypothetical protein ACJA1E_001572 [Paracoccaceae bacterium]|jgi:hypothetical protein|tara:strand:+ start:124 stop:426 length:303 start_codon:yes stop_codon:yes gene_type:complete
MCANCGFPAAAGHWTEAGSVTATDRMRARYRRAQVLNTVLPAFGLAAHDDGQVPGIALSSSTGDSARATDLEQFWILAEKMTGHAIDPLDPRLLALTVAR